MVFLSYKTKLCSFSEVKGGSWPTKVFTRNNCFTSLCNVPDEEAIMVTFIYSQTGSDRSMNLYVQPSTHGIDNLTIKPTSQHPLKRTSLLI